MTAKIIVLDDDPTGCQTVHGCLLLTQWDLETLRLGLQDQSSLLFILTNTRAIAPQAAEEVTRQVCTNLQLVLAELGIKEFLLVSRSDSTLRGHYPIETDAIAATLGKFDAHFLVPAFFEGGRFTRDSIHYLVVDGVPTPTHLTEFARDSVFGYSTSYLPDYVEEKTQGRIKAEQVQKFSLDQVQRGCLPELLQLQHNQCCVVDAVTQADLDLFARDILAATQAGKRFLFRSAASLLTALAQLPPQAIAPESMVRYRRSDAPGVVVVGSHVRKTSEQLAELLQLPTVVGVEVKVERLVDPATRSQTQASLCAEVLSQVQQIFDQELTPVIYTSRQELNFPDPVTRLEFGQGVSNLLMQIVQGLPPQLSFLISKGGITSNDVLSIGLQLKAARLLGQILAGCSVVTTPADHPLFPNLPVVLFPGNVGDRSSLATVYHRLIGAP
ncbi:MAG: four-carbon acid sugar kinase family protein [Pseudanabaenaceae cyanobacterium bins.68]|nr:four-carbon acid sugar kinase family protein [Pseudanabaenaceae cyanobacterium bins.68]